MTTNETVMPADVAGLVERLRDVARAYPVEMFPEVAADERDWLRAEKPGMQDRIAASMGRHLSKIIIEAATTLEAQAAELAAVRYANDYIDQLNVLCEDFGCEPGSNRIHWLHEQLSALAEARKALGLMLREHDTLSGNFGDVVDPKHRSPDRWPTAAGAARRALEGGE